jgi:hypothetical protein
MQAPECRSRQMRRAGSDRRGIPGGRDRKIIGQIYLSSLEVPAVTIPGHLILYGHACELSQSNKARPQWAFGRSLFRL